jgi:hypothetical protein
MYNVAGTMSIVIRSRSQNLLFGLPQTHMGFTLGAQNSSGALQTGLLSAPGLLKIFKLADSDPLDRFSKIGSEMDKITGDQIIGLRHHRGHENRSVF